jgi:hypothetical protein
MQVFNQSIKHRTSCKTGSKNRHYYSFLFINRSAFPVFNNISMMLILMNVCCLLCTEHIVKIVCERDYSLGTSRVCTRVNA